MAIIRRVVAFKKGSDRYAWEYAGSINQMKQIKQLFAVDGESDLEGDTPFPGDVEATRKLLKLMHQPPEFADQYDFFWCASEVR